MSTALEVADVLPSVTPLAVRSDLAVLLVLAVRVVFLEVIGRLGLAI